MRLDLNANPKTILQLTSSARGAASVSTQLANELTARLLEQNPGARLLRRDLAAQPVRMLDAEALGALSTPPEQRTAAQQSIVAEYDALIAEIQSADLVVFGVPMYNFSIPIHLKAYFDAIARAGVTFRYTPKGPEGLLQGKKVYVVFTRGGLYRGTSQDTQTPYLQTMLGFLGMTDVEFVFAEGLNMGPEALQAGLSAGRMAIATL